MHRLVWLSCLTDRVTGGEAHAYLSAADSCSSSSVVATVQRPAAGPPPGPAGPPQGPAGPPPGPAGPPQGPVAPGQWTQNLWSRGGGGEPFSR